MALRPHANVKHFFIVLSVYFLDGGARNVLVLVPRMVARVVIKCYFFPEARSLDNVFVYL